MLIFQLHRVCSPYRHSLLLMGNTEQKFGVPGAATHLRDGVASINHAQVAVERLCTIR